MDLQSGGHDAVSIGPVETFHEGESLGPAVSWLHGGIPYKDFIVLHGIFLDPLQAVLAFKLFGTSVAAYRSFQSLLEILSWISLSLLLIVLFRERYGRALMALMILRALLDHPRGYLSIPYRDAWSYGCVIAFLALYYFLQTPRPGIKRIFSAAFFSGFLAWGGFAISIDRGFYLTSALAFFSFFYFFSARARSPRLGGAVAVGFAAGTLAGILFLGNLLSWHFFDFIDFTFIKMPKYKELMDGQVYPFFQDPFFSRILILMAANTFWIAWKFCSHIFTDKKNLLYFFERFFPEILLWLLSLFFFRNALGRSDWPHIAYSAAPTFICSIFFLLKHGFHRVPPAVLLWGKRILLIYTALFLISASEKILYRGYLDFHFPFAKSDSELIPENYKATIAFLKSNLGKDETFFTLTSEAAWYYFLWKPSPTRFLTLWFAGPDFYQKEITADLEKKKVPYILYKNKSWYSQVDEIPNEKRFPILMDYLSKNYSFYRKIDDQELWKRKRLQ